MAVDNATAATGEKKAAQAPEGEAELAPWKVAACIFGIFFFLYMFLIGLGLMGDAFKCLGGRGAGSMFTGVNNPIAGLMVGILATVLVQSSSTSTSIVVGLVSADQITVRNGIPIIMGANIGTSVTNTIVSMGQIGNRIDLERAFSGATVHDMFNMLTVCTLLPIEIILAAISGEGGLLYWVSKGITEAAVGGDKSGELFPSPIKAITKPMTKLTISNNKYVINALSLGQPVEHQTVPGDVNATACGTNSRRLDSMEEAGASSFQGWQWVGDGGEAQVEESRALLSRRQLSEDSVDCSRYYCVGGVLDKNYKKISSKAYATLTKCGDYIVNDKCGSDKCYMDAAAYHDKYVTNGHIIKGGWVEGAGDAGGGIISLILSLLLLCAGLMGLVKCLQMLLIKKAKKIVAKATNLNDYLAILVGLGLTIIVQSSSVVTSALTPLCGMGVLPLQKMLPMTLGANIGTTITALIAALVTMKFGALQIALCHLLFNITGILIWFPFPPMRQIPLGAAKLLGLYASFYRFVPGLYILVMFVIVPGLLLGLSALYDASVAGGIILTLVYIAAVAGLVFWWVWMGGCYKVLSKEMRETRLQELEKSNSEMRGEDEEAAPKPQEASV